MLRTAHVPGGNRQGFWELVSFSLELDACSHLFDLQIDIENHKSKLSLQGAGTGQGDSPLV